MSQPAKIKIGSVIYLRHITTGTLLKSLPKAYTHQKSSGQQMVVASLEKTAETRWLVKRQHNRVNEKSYGDEVLHKEIIRLEHCATNRNLHSHGDRPSPVTNQQEVTCLGVNGVGDDNDDWIIELEGGGTWGFDQRVRLIHAKTLAALHSHGGQSHPVFTNGEQEVTGYAGRDDGDVWIVTPADQSPPEEPANRTRLTKGSQSSDKLVQETRDPSHPVWEVYDLRRTSRLNVKYYQRLGEKLGVINFRIELLLAITAPTSAVAGLVFWQTNVGKIAWGVLGTAAAFLSVAKPLLHLTDKIQNATEIHSGYAALEHDLDKLSVQIRHKGNYDEQLKKRFLELMDKKGKLVAMKDKNKQDAALKALCEAEVGNELPAEKFYIPPQ